MAYNIGINVVEVDGLGAPAIISAATSVGAFNILTSRGIPNRPTRVTNFVQFVEQFGGYFTGALGAYMVKGFFDNGGQTAWINRVIDDNPTTGHAPARITLQDGGNNDTLTLDAGFKGEEDPGTWGNGLHVEIKSSSSASSLIRETAKATIQSENPLAGTTDMTSLPTLSIVVDGEPSATEIAFQASDFSNIELATREEIRDAINRHTTKLIASLSETNHLVLTSTGDVAALTNGWSSLRITANITALGFSEMASAVTGTSAVISATGTQLAKVDDFQVGDAIQLSQGSNIAVTKLLSINPNTNDVIWSPEISNHGDFDGTQTTVSNLEFDLRIADGGAEEENVIETWTGLSMESDLTNYAPSVLNDTIRGSRYVIATDENSASTSGNNIPSAINFTRFTPGRDGTPTANHFVGSEASHTGFYSFDPCDIQLLCCERTDPTTVNAALGYCQKRGDCMFIGAVPEGFVGGDQAISYGKAFQGKKVYGALYGPWIKILDPISTSPTPHKFVNPSGHVMGVIARIETARGIWKAPAGDEANIIGALDVEYRLSDRDHTNLVKDSSVNGIRAVPAAGIIIDASRTLSTDTRWLYVNVRLLFNYVKSSLKNGLRWVRQEPNKDTLWNLVKYNSVIPFLMGLWRQGAFGTGEPDQVFTVICDATNNPPDEIDKGNFKLEVYFYPSKPAETIIIIVGQQPSGGTAAEA